LTSEDGIKEEYITNYDQLCNLKHHFYNKFKVRASIYKNKYIDWYRYYEIIIDFSKYVKIEVKYTDSDVRKKVYSNHSCHIIFNKIGIIEKSMLYEKD